MYGYSDSYAVFGGLSMVSMIVSLAVAVLCIASLWKIFQKAGAPGWAAIVPFYNLYILFEIAWGRGILFLLTLIPVANIVILAIAYYKLAKVFGKGTGFALGTVFLSPVFLAMLAFGDSSYRGVTTSMGGFSGQATNVSEGPVVTGQNYATAPVSQTTPVPPPAPQPVPAGSPAAAPLQGNPASVQNPSQDDKGGFGFSLAGIITAVLGISIVGLVLSIVGFSKARASKLAGIVGDRIKDSYVMSIIGMVLSALGIVTQVIMLVAVFVFGALTIPFIEDLPNRDGIVIDGDTNAITSIFDRDETDAVASDLKTALMNDLEVSDCPSGMLQLRNLWVDSNDRYVDDDGYNCETVEGFVTVIYDGRTEDVGFFADYIEVDGYWYLYDYGLDSYDIFPESFIPNSAIYEGIYAPSERSINTGGSSDNGNAGSLGNVAGSYYCVTDTPDTSPYPGLVIDTADTTVFATVSSNGSMDLEYYFEGTDPEGYVNVVLPVQIPDASVTYSQGTYWVTGSALCTGIYTNMVGGGATVPCTVDVMVDATIDASGVMTGTLTQTLHGFDDPSGMYDPTGVFDTSFSFTAYKD